MSVFLHYLGVKTALVPGSAYLVSVWANGASDAWVAGRWSDNVSTSYHVIRHWTGSGWTALDSTDPRAVFIQLSQVYAADNTHVYFAHGGDNRIFQWDGTVQTAVLIDATSSPQVMFPITGNELYVTQGFEHTLYRWHTTNGTTWTRTSIGNSSGDNWGIAQLGGVDLASLHFAGQHQIIGGLVAAVGAYGGSSIVSEWESTYFSSYASWVWFASTTDGWAVVEAGDSGDGQLSHPQVLTNSGGTTWTAMTVQPLTHTQLLAAPGHYFSIGGTSTTEFWVGGDYAGQPYVWHWTGTAWAATTFTTLFGYAAGTIDAIHARTSSDVWAVGGMDAASAYLLAFHWNGTAWADRSMPN